MIKHEVRLEEFELRLAAMVGAERYIQAITRKLQELHGDDNDSTWATHIEGACGEMAYAKFRGIYWNGSVNTFRAPDVGSRIQIRTRSRHDYELFVRPTRDKDDDIFVLVTGKAPIFWVRGFMRGIDAKKPEWLKDHGGRPPAHFIPNEALRKFPDSWAQPKRAQA
jgi:hypothetical protein